MEQRNNVTAVKKKENSTAAEETIWNKNFVILFVINIITFLGYQMLNPIIPEYAEKAGMVPSTVGFLAGAYCIAALVSRPFSGYFADRLNKKFLVVLSLSGLVICFLGYPVIINPYLLILVRIFHGIFFGLNSTVTMTMVSDILPPSKLSSGLGLFSVTTVVSMAIAPSIGIWVVDTLGYPALFLISSGITAISLMLAFSISRSPKQPAGVGRGLAFKNFFSMEALSPAVICVLVASNSGLCSNFMVLYGNAMKISNIGLFFTVYAITILIVRPCVGRISDRIAPVVIGVPCCAVSVAAMVMLWRAKTLPFILIAGILFGIGYSILPLLQSMCIKLVAPERRGVASSTYYIGLDIGNAVGPIVAGILSASVGYADTFLFFSLPDIVAILIFLYLNRRKTAAGPGTL